MNRIYRIIFSQRLGIWQAKAETVHGHGKRAGRCQSAWTLAGAMLLACVPQPAMAQQAFWISTDGDWFDPTKWTSSQLPGTNDNVYIGHNGTVTFDPTTGTTSIGTVILGHNGWSPGNGALRILSGTLEANNVAIASAGGHTADLWVSGSNAALLQTGSTPFRIGSDGKGTLTIEHGGTVSVAAGTNILLASTIASISGAIHLNGTTDARGVLETGEIRGAGNGRGSLHINGGVLRALKDNQDFVGGPNPGTSLHSVLLGAAGGFVDSGGHNIGIKTNITGVGGLTKQGNGLLVLSGENNYSGGTTVAQGSLRAGASQAFPGNTAYVVNGGTLDLHGSALVMSSLAGTGGTVSLGTATLSVQQSTDTAYQGAITGTGTLFKAGTGTLILSTGQYSGGTTVEAGTLRAGSATALPANTAYTINGGTLDLNSHALAMSSLAGNGGTVSLGTGDLTVSQAANTSYAGVITGNGGFAKQGAGTLTLAGTSSALAGPTTVQAGTLQVDGSLGGAVTVAAGGTLAGSGALPGAVSVADDGTLRGVQGQTLTTGSLALAPGARLALTLDAPGGARLFQVNGDLTLGGTLDVTDAGGYRQGVYRLIDYTGTLTDNTLALGSLPAGLSPTVQTSVSSQVNLVVASPPAPPGPAPTPTPPPEPAPPAPKPPPPAPPSLLLWKDTTGSHRWAADTTPDWTDGSGTRTHAWNGSFAVFQERPAALTVSHAAGPVLATGMQFIGSGWTILGDAIVLQGADGSSLVRVGDGSAAGAGSSATVASVLAGDSRLVKDDHGTLVLRGDNTYVGGTLIRAGTLQLGAGGTAGSILGDVTTHGTLAFDRSDARTFAGTISGSGEIRQAGQGLTRLTADSSAFAGTSRVARGTLAVDGALGGALDVQHGGRLEGSGTVGATRVDGVIAPGNSIGTLRVGSLVFGPGAHYEVETDPSGRADRIEASGAAILNGGAVRVFAGDGDYAAATDYTILSAAGGLSGTFDSVGTDHAFLHPSLRYDAHAAYLRLTRNDIAFRDIALTPNQAAAGAGLDSLGPGQLLYDTILALPADQARQAFDLLSGEIHASASSARIEDSRFVRHAANDRLRAAFAQPGAARTPVTAYGLGTAPAPVSASHAGPVFWSQAFGTWGSTTGDGNAATLNRNSGGLLLGLDGSVGDWRLGLLAGYGHTTQKTRARNASGSSYDYHLGAFGGTTWGQLNLRAGAVHTWHDTRTARTATLPGLHERLGSQYKAATTQVFGELGYGFRAGSVQLEPFANLTQVRLRTQGFSEQGGTAALAVAAARTRTTFATLGLRGEHALALGRYQVSLKGTLGWRHAFGDRVPTSTHRFVGGSAYTIAGVPIARNSAVVEAGLALDISSRTSFSLSYTGQLAASARDHGLKAQLSMRF